MVSERQETLVIVNPASAGGRTGRMWPELRAALVDAGVEVEARLTALGGEATSITREALGDGVHRIVAVGGDGTLNEVVNGFFDEAGAPIGGDACVGLLPSGTGGDFRRSAGIPLAPGAATALLARGDTRLIDVGRIDYSSGGHRHFVNIADCGLGGEVVAAVDAGNKTGSASATFLYHSLRSLLAYGRRPARIEIDGVPVEMLVQNVVVANGAYFGGGMRIAPGAELGDGLFDVVVTTAGRMRSLVEIRRVYDGSHIGRRGVLTARAREVRVTPLDGARLRFDVEGEQIGEAPATLRVLPGAIRLCAPMR